MRSFIQRIPYVSQLLQERDGLARKLDATAEQLVDARRQIESLSEKQTLSDAEAAKSRAQIGDLLAENSRCSAELATVRGELATRDDIAALVTDIGDQLRTQMPLLQAQVTAISSGQAEGFRALRDRLSLKAGGRGSVGRDMYLDLLETALTGTLYADESDAPWAKDVYDPGRRAIGRDWPRSAQTMIGTARMRNLRNLLERAIVERVEGDFIETGVWRGGACIYAKGILKAYGDETRRVFVADSFKGLPPPDDATYPADKGDEHHTVAELAISRDDVVENFRRYGLLDEQVVFLEGWFKDTLPGAPVEKLAVLRLDGDMYESTMDALNALYHKVSPGGFVIVDDYVLPACAKAIHDFRDQRGITAVMEPVDGAAVWWQVPA